MIQNLQSKSRLIKEIYIDPNFEVPLELKFEDFIARPLTREDLEEDLKAVLIQVLRSSRKQGEVLGLQKN